MMKNFYSLKSAVVIIFLFLQPGYSRSEDSLFTPEIANSSLAKRVFTLIEKNKDNMLTEWIALAEIPAPSGREEKRARYIREAYLTAGLDEVSLDPSGNVVGIWRGSGSGKGIVLAAHMDTVFKDLRVIKAEKEGDIIKAPGICDDTASLIHLLWTVRLLKQAGFKPGNSYFFVATVKEELGALGMRAFMNSTQEKVDIAIALDGNLGEVEYGALGIHSRKVIFRGPGAHTMRSKGVPNPNLAVARAVQDILCLAVPEAPEEKWTVINIGQIGGGTVTNALSQESFFTLDIRSGDQAVLDGLIKEVVKISERIATEMKLQIHYEVFEDSKACQIPGAKETVLVRTAVDVLSYLGVKDIYLTPFGSTDAAASLEKGIPSISLGRASCRKRHTLDEEADISSFYTSLKQILLVLLSLEGPDGLR